MVSLPDVLKILDERPRKFSPEDVGYEIAPEGSAIVCASCYRYFRRVRDNHGVCEIMRSEETDIDGVQPDFRCQFFTSDGMIYILQGED